MIPLLERIQGAVCNTKTTGADSIDSAKVPEPIRNFDPGAAGQPTFRIYCGQLEQLLWPVALQIFKIFRIVHICPPARIFEKLSPDASAAAARRTAKGQSLCKLRIRS
jgi:hypothetical protein